MISIGLDPSMTAFGWCVHDAAAEGVARVIDRGRFVTSPRNLFITRYVQLRQDVGNLLDRYPDARVVGVESPPFGELWSEGLYGLFLYVCEAIHARRRDVVFFDPSTLKLLVKGDPNIKGKMFKQDMVSAAREDTGIKGRFDHNEADAYHVARFAARFFGFLEGSITAEELTPAERHVFCRTHTFTRGKRAGETTRDGTVFREGERFFRWSQAA